MKKPKLKSRIALLIISFIAAIPLAFSQDVGATFCWHYNEIYGGDVYAFNQSIAKKGLPADNTHWSTTTEWWENMAEEIEYSGIDFIALLSRGTTPAAPDRGNGNPNHISKLINAMNATGATFKVAIFDDCPNSWTGAKNWNESAGATYSTDSPKFDCAVTANWQYIYEMNIKPTWQAIPDAKRYKIDGRPVIWFWGAKPSWMNNLQGNLSKILTHIKTKCQADFGFTPYLIIEKSWLDNDSTITTAHADGVHGWFTSATQISHTLWKKDDGTLWNGKKFGALCPGFGYQGNAPFMDPKMGYATGNERRLKAGLDATVGDGAISTLVEGFTDAAESAALWRSNDTQYYDYPNERLNMLRRYTSDPYPATLKIQAEACDSFSDLTTGNSGGAYRRGGNLDIEKCADTKGGWNVTATQANEWMQWEELPLLKNTKFQLRYRSTASASIKYSVDGTALSTITLPSTNDVWTTIDAGNYTTASNSLHTVKLTIVSGSPDINYTLRVNGTVAVSGVTLTPATASLSIGNTQQLIATVAPSNATNKTVTWSTSNASVATVNSTGLVTAIASGTATITCTTQDGNKTASSLITVASASNTIQIIQAENAAYSGAVIASNQTGFNGTGFIDFVNATGDYVQWTVNVPTAGSYDLSFRYALPSGGRPLELKVNGTVKVASLDFPATGLWTTWEKVITTQTLNAGNNTIKLTTNGSNGGNIDELKVVPYLDDCDAINGWSNATANSLTYYTTDKKQGTGCVQMIGSATEEFKKVFSPAFNSGTSIANGVLSFWYYVSDVTKCGTVRVELGSGGAADINELSWPLTGLSNGWNQISLNISDASQIGTPNMNALNWFRIYDTKTASITTRIDAIQILDNSIAASSQRIGKTLSTITNETSKSLGKSIRIFPNPYKQGKLEVNLNGFENAETVQLKITNLLGQLIHQEVLTDKSHNELNLSTQLTESVYFISVESDGVKIVKKLMVK